MARGDNHGAAAAANIPSVPTEAEARENKRKKKNTHRRRANKLRVLLRNQAKFLDKLQPMLHRVGAEIIEASLVVKAGAGQLYQLNISPTPQGPNLDEKKLKQRVIAGVAEGRWQRTLKSERLLVLGAPAYRESFSPLGARGPK